MNENLAVNAIRILSADAVQKANSGHPGLPLGAAPIAYELWAHGMKHNPKNPKWIDRDRFILSAGHGSAMLYSLFHLFGYGLEIEDLKNFRQLDSKTPGHPEYGHTTGVEATTGPLGAGLGMAVGMAVAEKHLAAKYNREGYKVFDHYTYAICGEGCLMEGISSEVMSFAGTNNLDKLIILYDCNKISIEGNTDIAFKEDVAKRFESFGFSTFEVKDGNNIEEIGKAIEAAKADKSGPSFITIHTHIGYGVPAKQDKSAAHGEPLGEENVAILRENLDWPSKEAFEVPGEVYDFYKELIKPGAKAEEAWNEMYKEYSEKYPELRAGIDKDFAACDLHALCDSDDFWKNEKESEATRVTSYRVLNALKDEVTNLIGGSADLAPSNKSYMEDKGDFSAEDYSGRNLHFGVRELGMTAIVNGIVLHGGLNAYCSTFFVFSDYMKPMLRLASLMGIPTISILTHDSIGVGEDGPTHEPIEQLTMLRAMPNFHVFRPADEVETKAAWISALTNGKTPTAFVLSRQNLTSLDTSSKEALKGGYIVRKESKDVPDGIVIATGSEVKVAIDAAEKLSSKMDIRVVSMPCLDLFEEQDASYKESILPKAVTKRAVVEAGSSLSWGKYIGTCGTYITIDGFGASAPAGELFKKFGLDEESVAKRLEEAFE